LVRGRPRKKGSLYEFIRINQELKQILYYEKRRGERYNDTLLRIVREKNQMAIRLKQYEVE
jgi:hypothetical protein